MKKSFIFIFFAIVINTLNAQTSVYHPFPDSEAVWNISRSGGQLVCGFNPSIPYHETFSYTFSGDTVISSLAYHKLFIPFVQWTDTCSFTGWHTSPGYVGCIRQNIAGKRVYFIASGETNEYILYDFNLEPGDSVFFPPSFNCGNLVNTVKRIDSVLIGSDYRKVWILNKFTFTDTSFIEGIGYSSGLLAPCSYPDADWWGLACFQQNGSILYHTDSTVSCDIIASATKFFEPANTLMIYPNPTSGAIIISIDKNIKRGYVNVFNIMGENVFSEPFMNNQKMINLKLSSGIYFLQVTSGFENWATRFIME